MRIGLAVAVVVAVAAIVVCLVPSKQVPYTILVDYKDTETYYEDEPYQVTESYNETQPLQYRELDSFTTEAISDVEARAAMRGYDLPDETVEWPYFAVYVVVENLDDVPGTFEVRYSCIGTADKGAAETYQWLLDLTSEEYQDLDIECYVGSTELYLQPQDVGVAICPESGVEIRSDRVPWWSDGYDVIPDSKIIEYQRTVTKYRQVEKQRTVAKQRPETRYKKVTLLDYLVHY